MLYANRKRKNTTHKKRRVGEAGKAVYFGLGFWNNLLMALILAFCASTSLVMTVSASSGHHFTH
jgi:hypothetical protein